MAVRVSIITRLRNLMFLLFEGYECPWSNANFSMQETWDTSREAVERNWRDFPASSLRSFQNAIISQRDATARGGVNVAYDWWMLLKIFWKQVIIHLAMLLKSVCSLFSYFSDFWGRVYFLAFLLLWLLIDCLQLIYLSMNSLRNAFASLILCWSNKSISRLRHHELVSWCSFSEAGPLVCSRLSKGNSIERECNFF